MTTRGIAEHGAGPDTGVPSPKLVLHGPTRGLPGDTVVRSLAHVAIAALKAGDVLPSESALAHAFGVVAAGWHGVLAMIAERAPGSGRGAVMGLPVTRL